LAICSRRRGAGLLWACCGTAATHQIGHLLSKEVRRPAAGLPQACRMPAAGLLWACWGTADTPDLNSQKS